MNITVWIAKEYCDIDGIFATEALAVDWVTRQGEGSYKIYPIEVVTTADQEPDMP